MLNSGKKICASRYKKINIVTLVLSEKKILNETKNHNPPFKLNGRSLNVLRKLKYRLNRNYLEKLYLTFIRPVLEYASEVWDNCGQINSDRLEKVQLEAARIVTGLLSFASINSIYIETGWEKLKTRREVRKLVLFY
jgi:hypothetical protein